MIKIETYIKKNKLITSLDNIDTMYSDYFVLCKDEKCLCYINDVDYLEGAIIILYNERTVLSFRQWDLVDQLWSYLISAIERIVSHENEVSFFFPDQPLKFTMHNISEDHVLLCISEIKTTVDKREFILTALHAAKKFFNIISKYDNKLLLQQSNKELNKIESIIQKVNKTHFKS